MKFKALLTLCLLIPLLSGCITMQAQPDLRPSVALYGQQNILLPTPEQLNMQLNATQLLTATYGSKQYTAQIQLEATHERLVMVALGAFGSQVFSINYDGRQINSKSLPMKHASLGINHALSDFIFAYASPDVIKQMLQGTKYSLKQLPKQRWIMFENQPIIRIDYQSSQPWQGQVVIQNLIYHYQVTMTTVSITPTGGQHHASLS